MNITIQKAKNEEETAVADGHFLHSNYAPKKEAERFVENLKIPYNPSAIIITEPALSYVTEYLKKKFPGVKLGAIRYSETFASYNKAFDFVLNYYEHENFEVYLECRFTEEELLTIYFIPWSTSSQVFSEADKKVWNAIKASLLRSKTLLITRQYFEKKWFINSCNFIKYSNNFIRLNFPVSKDVLIISSGPSLIPFINCIREKQNNFFIICLSSAIKACLKNNIIPDLCMSTDGGYWASEHLKPLYKNDIPLALTVEGYCKKSLLSKLKILPLDYGDGISHALLQASKIEAARAIRNGTVSGTALLFASLISEGNIYLCGLDLACQKGFQHIQPNQLEENSSIFDNRIKSKMTRLTRSQLTNDSLEIYKNWFINNHLNIENRKVYRLIENEDRKNNLSWITDLDLSSFNQETSKKSENKKISCECEKINSDLKAAVQLLFKTEYIEAWKKQLFPLDFVQLSHDPQNKEIINKIEKEWNELKAKAERILNADI